MATMLTNSHSLNLLARPTVRVHLNIATKNETEIKDTQRNERKRKKKKTWKCNRKAPKERLCNLSSILCLHDAFFTVCFPYTRAYTPRYDVRFVLLLRPTATQNTNFNWPFTLSQPQQFKMYPNCFKTAWFMWKLAIAYFSSNEPNESKQMNSTLLA